MKANRIGEMNFNRFGSDMILEKYNSCSDIVVRFVENGNLVNTIYDRFKKGDVRNPYDKTVCGVGYLGEGIHKVSENGKMTKMYTVWNSMLHRAYNEKYHNRFPSYKDVTVCREWHNFQVFGDWFQDNYYKIENEIMCMDKDILIKGNKLYSPETVCFVPERINTLIVKCNGSRGELPVGVAFNKLHKKYQSQVANGKGEIIRLGAFDTPEEAFLEYKLHKENLIKEVANEYKEKIPLKLYEALIKYQVEIDD